MILSVPRSVSAQAGGPRAPLDRPQPLAPDQAAAGPDRKPVEAEAATGVGVGAPDPGLGRELPGLEPEVEGDLGVARLLEGGELLAALDPPQAARRLPEAADAGDDELPPGLLVEDPEAHPAEAVEHGA